MIESGAIRADIRFDSGSVERLFAAPEAALADAEGFWERREEPMRCAFAFRLRDEGVTGLGETTCGRDAPPGGVSTGTG